MAHIEVRQAQPEDREAVLTFCRDTWEWSCYIEYAWDEWLTDSNGSLFVATVDGHLAGVEYVSMVTKVDAWLEGLHVDPQFRRQGVARALNDAVLLEAMQCEAQYVRLQIRSDNTRSQKIVTSAYFRHVGSFTLFHVSPSPAELGRRRAQERSRLATLDDLDTIIDFLNVSNIFPLVGGLYYARFKAYPITVELLEEKITAQQVYVLYRWDRLDGLAIAEMCEVDGKKRFSVGYIDGTAIEPISLLAYDLRRRLNELELEGICVCAPDLVLIRDAFTGVGYEWDAKIFYTYERGLD